MSILSRLFRNKVDEDEAADEIKELDLLYAEVYPALRQAEITYIPSPVVCEYCGNESQKSDGRSGCVSCGAPLHKITKQIELSYYYTT